MRGLSPERSVRKSRPRTGSHRLQVGEQEGGREGEVRVRGWRRNRRESERESGKAGRQGGEEGRERLGNGFRRVGDKRVAAGAACGREEGRVGDQRIGGRWTKMDCPCRGTHPPPCTRRTSCPLPWHLPSYT